MPPSRSAAACAAGLLAMSALGGCARSGGSSPTTLQPLVTAAPAGADATTTAPTTTAFVSDPASPLLAVVPESDCALAPVGPAGEITFVVGDRLFGVAADGTAARCLAALAPQVRGPVSWSPDATRAVVGGATMLDVNGPRSTGFNPDNLRVQWEYPSGAGLFGPTATNNTLVRRDAANSNARSEITFLAQTLFAVSHPTGEALIGAGIDPTGSAGVFLAEPNGRNRRPLLTTSGTTEIAEIAADPGGDAIHLVARSGAAFSVLRLDLRDFSILEMASDAAPAGDLTVGPVAGTVAWRVGLCNAVTELRVRDEVSGTTRGVDETTPLAGLSLSPVGWLDAARLVLAARPLGCDGPADVWIWNLLDGSATLLTKNVEHVAVRIPFPGGAAFNVSPDAAPAQL
jgi:hypothetical protein